MIDFIKDLNEKQQLGVLKTEGACLLIAGAGSGKTRVLTYRIANLLQKGTSPWQILALTFTNKAAKEMRERIENLVGTDARDLWMGTFHSMFARILRFDGDRLGYRQGFSIYDTDDSKSLIKNIVKEMGLDDKIYQAAGMFNRISSLKNSLISAQEYNQNAEFLAEDALAKRPHFGKIYQTYAARCFGANAMDFDDLLFQTFVLFRDHKDVLHKYQHRFKYILIDEFQDTNIAQYKIIKKLAAVNLNICVVGDDAQSIYAFRGADIRNILNFERDYPDLEIIKLEQNYRSTKTIVEAANKIIKNNKNQIEKNVWTENIAGEKIELIRATSDQEEGRIIAGNIFETRAQKNARLNDFAILYRTNAQSRTMEEALRRLNVKYRIIGGLSFYQRKEIKDLLAYFRLAVNPEDEEALRRAINNPKRGIGDTTVLKVFLASRENNVPISKVTRHASAYLGKGRAGTSVEKFGELAKAFQIIASENDAHTAAKYIAQHSGIVKALFDDETLEGRARYENVQELLNATQEFVQNKLSEATTEDPDVSLSLFLQEVALLTSVDQASEDEDAVTMMTIHAAKGLEFDYVYLVGMEEELFPSSRMIASLQDLEEERRLFYVAVTRAKERLTLSYALQRYRYGSFNSCEPSRFLFEIEQSLFNARSRSIQKNNPTHMTNFMRHRAEQNKEIDSKTSSPNSKLKPISSVRNTPFVSSKTEDIVEGIRVEHPKFGFGTVKKIDSASSGKRATIHFDTEGEKTLILSFAKLRVVNE